MANTTVWTIKGDFKDLKNQLKAVKAAALNAFSGYGDALSEANKAQLALNAATAKQAADLKPLQKELLSLKNLKAANTELTKEQKARYKELTAEIAALKAAHALNNAELQKTITQQNRLAAVRKREHTLMNQTAQAIKKETQAVKEGSKSRLKEGAERRALGTTLVRHIRRLESLAVAYFAVTRAYQATFGAGVQLNREYENMELGLAAILAAKTEVVSATGQEVSSYVKLQIAQKQTAETLTDIKKAALDTPATFSQMVGFYQQAIGHALAAGDSFGSSLDEISQNTIDLTKRMSSLGASVGMSMDLINEEIRSLMSGDVSRDSKLALILFGSPTVANAAIKEAKQQAGGLTDLFNEMLAPFVALEGIMTFDKQVNHLIFQIQELQREASKPVFDDLQESFRIMTNYLAEDGEGIADSFKKLYEGVKLTASYLDELIALYAAFKVGGAIATGVTTLIKLTESFNKVRKAGLAIAKAELIVESALQAIKTKGASIAFGTAGAAAAYVLIDDALSSVVDNAKRASDELDTLNSLLEKGITTGKEPYKPFTIIEPQISQEDLKQALAEAERGLAAAQDELAAAFKVGDKDAVAEAARAVQTYQRAINNLQVDLQGFLQLKQLEQKADEETEKKRKAALDSYTAIWEHSLKMRKEWDRQQEEAAKKVERLQDAINNVYMDDVDKIMLKWSKAITGITDPDLIEDAMAAMRDEIAATSKVAESEFIDWGKTLNSSISNSIVDALQSGDVSGAVEGLAASVTSAMMQATVGNIVNGNFSWDQITGGQADSSFYQGIGGTVGTLAGGGGLAANIGSLGGVALGSSSAVASALSGLGAMAGPVGMMAGGLIGGLAGGLFDKDDKPNPIVELLKKLDEKAEARNRTLDAQYDLATMSGQQGTAINVKLDQSLSNFTLALEKRLVDEESYRIDPLTGKKLGERFTPEGGFNFQEYRDLPSQLFEFIVQGMERTIEGRESGVYGQFYDVSQDLVATIQDTALAFEDLNSHGNYTLKTLGDGLVTLGTDSAKAAHGLITLSEGFKAVYDQMDLSGGFAVERLNDALADLEASGLIASSAFEDISSAVFTFAKLSDTVTPIYEGLLNTLQTSTSANLLLQELADNETGAIEAVRILRESGFAEVAAQVEQLNGAMSEAYGVTDLTVESVINLADELELVAQAAIKSRDNLKTWRDSFKTDTEIAEDMAAVLGVTLPGSVAELESVLTTLLESGLSDQELDFLFKAKGLLEETADNLVDSISKADSLLASIRSAAESAALALRGGVTSSYGFGQFQTAMVDALRLQGSGDIEAFADAVKKASQFSGSLMNLSNFAGDYYEQQYQKGVAAVQFDKFAELTETDIDILRAVNNTLQSNNTDALLAMNGIKDELMKLRISNTELQEQMLAIQQETNDTLKLGA